MKRIYRRQLRGRALDTDCIKANTTSNEYGKDDMRVFCYGLYKEMSDCDIQEKCIKCNAYVGNAKPLEG